MLAKKNISWGVPADPDEQRLPSLDSAEVPADEEENLVRRATMHKAQAFLLSAAQEEKSKEEILSQHKGTVEDNIRQMAELQKISISQTMQDREYFYDNAKIM